MSQNADQCGNEANTIPDIYGNTETQIALSSFACAEKATWKLRCLWAGSNWFAWRA